MEVRQVSTTEIYPLRAKVLRPGKPLESCRNDRDEEGVHFACLVGGEIVSVVTAHPDQHPDFPESNQWRIRGMATDFDHQGKGYGGALLLHLLEWGKSKGIPLFWCNAREKAIPFYQRHGFTVESGLFEIPLIGLHKVMKAFP